MIKGLVKQIYRESARPLRDDSELAGIVRLWLRAGYGRSSIFVIRERLDPYGVDAAEFVEAFDFRSRSIAGSVVPVTIRIWKDGTYDFDFGRVSRVRPPLIPEAMDPYRHS